MNARSLVVTLAPAPTAAVALRQQLVLLAPMPASVLLPLAAGLGGSPSALGAGGTTAGAGGDAGDDGAVGGVDGSACRSLLPAAAATKRKRSRWQ